MQACGICWLRATASATVTAGEPCAGFTERLPPGACFPSTPYSNPHNRAAVCCAALDVCCRQAAHALFPLEAALDAAGAGAGDDNGSDGTMSYEACRAEKLALLRAVDLACDDAPAGGPSRLWATPAQPLPVDLLKAAQVCCVALRGCAGGLSSHRRSPGQSQLQWCCPVTATVCGTYIWSHTLYGSEASMLQ